MRLDSRLKRLVKVGTDHFEVSVVGSLFAEICEHAAND